MLRLLAPLALASKDCCGAWYYLASLIPNLSVKVCEPPRILGAGHERRYDDVILPSFPKATLMNSEFSVQLTLCKRLPFAFFQTLRETTAGEVKHFTSLRNYHKRFFLSSRVTGWKMNAARFAKVCHHIG